MKASKYTDLDYEDGDGVGQGLFISSLWHHHLLQCR